MRCTQNHLFPFICPHGNRRDQAIVIKSQVYNMFGGLVCWKPSIPYLIHIRLSTFSHWFDYSLHIGMFPFHLVIVHFNWCTSPTLIWRLSPTITVTNSLPFPFRLPTFITHWSPLGRFLWWVFARSPPWPPVSHLLILFIFPSEWFPPPFHCHSSLLSHLDISVLLALCQDPAIFGF